MAGKLASYVSTEHPGQLSRLSLRGSKSSTACLLGVTTGHVYLYRVAINTRVIPYDR